MYIFHIGKRCLTFYFKNVIITNQQKRGDKSSASNVRQTWMGIRACRCSVSPGGKAPELF